MSKDKIETKNETKISNKPSKPAEKPQKVIYLGVPLVEKSKNGTVIYSLNYGTIFSNGLPDLVIERCQNDKDFEKMFVTVEKAGLYIKEMANPDSDFSNSRKKIRR